MKFDLFFELPLADAAHKDEARLYRELITQCELADRLGYNAAWLVEHHFMPGYSHSSAPDLLLSAIAMRTRQLRLGLAVVPLPYHHPITVTERLATLDVLSAGRVEFGFGRGFSPREHLCFGSDMAQARVHTEQALQVIQHALINGEFKPAPGYEMLTNEPLVPQPVQSEGLPTWMACVSPDSFTRAADLQVNVLVGPFKPWFMTKRDIRTYQRACHKKATKPGCVGMAIGILCLPDGKQARQLAREHFVWFYQQLLQVTRPVLEQLYDGYDEYRRFGKLTGLFEKLLDLRTLEWAGMVIVGDPAHCIKRLQQLADAGVDQVLLAVGAGVMPDELIQESMQLLAEKVMPACVRYVPS